MYTYLAEFLAGVFTPKVYLHLYVFLIATTTNSTTLVSGFSIIQCLVLTLYKRRERSLPVRIGTDERSNQLETGEQGF